MSENDNTTVLLKIWLLNAVIQWNSLELFEVIHFAIKYVTSFASSTGRSKHNTVHSICFTLLYITLPYPIQHYTAPYYSTLLCRSWLSARWREWLLAQSICILTLSVFSFYCSLYVRTISSVSLHFILVKLYSMTWPEIIIKTSNSCLAHKDLNRVWHGPDDDTT